MGGWKGWIFYCILRVATNEFFSHRNIKQWKPCLLHTNGRPPHSMRTWIFDTDEVFGNYHFINQMININPPLTWPIRDGGPFGACAINAGCQVLFNPSVFCWPVLKAGRMAYHLCHYIANYLVTIIVFCLWNAFTLSKESKWDTMTKVSPTNAPLMEIITFRFKTAQCCARQHKDNKDILVRFNPWPGQKVWPISHKPYFNISKKYFPWIFYPINLVWIFLVTFNAFLSLLLIRNGINIS